jgi:S1-C subfamily serine protease
VSKRALACGIVSVILIAGCVGSPDDETAPTTSTTARTASSDGITREAREVTLRVRNLGCGGIATGSGIAISHSTLITNRHVVAGAERLEISTWDGRTLVVGVRGVSRTADIAVVDVHGSLPAVASRHRARLAHGERVVVAGYPEGGQLTFRQGRVVDYVGGGQFEQQSDVMRSTAEVLPGNSGGPVFDRDGELVGVTFGIERRTGHALAIPADSLDREAHAPEPSCSAIP